MKFNIKHLSVAGLLVAAAVSFGSCTDEIKFGDSFLEKAPGGTVTADTVFHNAEYTRRFLAANYARQYHNMPVKGSNLKPQWINWFKGMPDALADTHHLPWNGSLIWSAYYIGSLTSNTDSNDQGTVFPYNAMNIWETVRASLMLIQRIDEVPDMDQAEKEHMKDEARCLMAAAYFNLFRFYGGLPIITQTFTGSESSYQGRGTAQETIDHIVGMLDEVINGNHLDWGYSGAIGESETGRWTLAGAMALKCEVLQFAASPLLNSAQPYYQGKYTVEHPEYTWLGGEDQGRWVAFRQACEQFFNALNSKGIYHLQQPEGDTQADYRFAYRYAYTRMGSPEQIHTVRCGGSANGNDYAWYNIGWANGAGNIRLAYSPTQEYIEMFPWADGTPFNWEESAALPDDADKSLDHMFIHGDVVEGQRLLQNRRYTRDPRLYETAAVNGAEIEVNWDDGTASGNPWECWVKGTNAGDDPATRTNVYATGYFNLKYQIGECFRRQKPMWNYLTLSRMYLNYAEAILMSGGSNAEAVKYVDAVRARVGLGGLVECNPDKNLLNDDKALLEEILRERACEGALDMVRYFDLIRYKRADQFEKKLHGIEIHRMHKNDAGEWEEYDRAWWNGQNTLPESDPDFHEPSHFSYKRTEIITGARVWWTDGFDPKWYFQPFPLTEVNKGYGLEQNPGW